MASVAGLAAVRQAFGHDLDLSALPEYAGLPVDTPPQQLVRYPQETDLILMTDRPPQLETPLRYFRSDLTPNVAFFVRWHLAGIPTTSQRRPCLPLVSVAALLFASQSGQPQADTSTASGKTDGGKAHSITLPDIPPEIPQGPHVDTFTRNCLICHSARYVLIQPPFSKAVWESEVKKMVAAYGASISLQDQERIVEYLDAVNEANSRQTSTAPQK